tara:strand:- start:804 stop:1289 length:486 start_codon:yes stop_codon:yes gene_type:complete
LAVIHKQQPDKHQTTPIALSSQQVFFEQINRTKDEHILARAAAIDFRDQRTQAQNPLILMTNPTRQVILSAQKGAYDSHPTDPILTLNGDVLIILHENDSDPIFLSTSSASINTAEKTVTSHSQTTAVRSMIITDSPNGFTLDGKSALSFHGNTHITILPT